MFVNRYIPWSSKYGLQEPKETAPAPTAAFCPRTIHIARAIMAKAVEPFPEVASVISAAFLAFIRGELKIDMTGDPSSWAVT